MPTRILYVDDEDDIREIAQDIADFLDRRGIVYLSDAAPPIRA